MDVLLTPVGEETPTPALGPSQARLVGVQIPAHLCSDVALTFERPPQGGLTGWKSSTPPVAFWSGVGYASLALKSKVDIMKNSGQEGAILTGLVFFYFDVAANAQYPAASDHLLLDGVACEVLSIRPANSLIDYWKAEVRTGNV
jgi:hypothetical protein